VNETENVIIHVMKFPVQILCLKSRRNRGSSLFSFATTENSFRYLTVALSLTSTIHNFFTFDFI